MPNKRKGEIAPGYKPVEVFGHLLKIDGRQVYHHEGRNEYSIVDLSDPVVRSFCGYRLVGLGERERIIVEHALQWAKEE